MNKSERFAPLRRIGLLDWRPWVVAWAIVVGGCATTTSPTDPLENYNRAVFSFNDSLDRNVLKPVAETYRTYVPAMLRTGVRNFFANLGDVWIGANNLFQAKVGDAVSDWMRVLMNTTFGIGGLYDVASDAGLEKHNEDFGQTLGWWGIPSGPFVVLPFFGPSTMRDAPALAVDMSASLTGRVAALANDQYETALRWSMWSVSIVNQRADALEATGLLSQAAIDPYAFARDAFMQRRQNLVYDGNPPRRREPDARAPAAPDTELSSQTVVNSSPAHVGANQAVSPASGAALRPQPGAGDLLGQAGELGATTRQAPVNQRRNHQ